MKTKNNKIEMKMQVKETDSCEGLNNDIWCMVKYFIKTPDYIYEIERKSLTKKEYENGIKKMIEFFENPTKEKIKLRFIKNYFKIDLYLNKNKEKELKFELVKENKKNNYPIYLTEDEIKDFIKMSKDAKKK